MAGRIRILILFVVKNKMFKTYTYLGCFHVLCALFLGIISGGLYVAIAILLRNHTLNYISYFFCYLCLRKIVKFLYDPVPKNIRYINVTCVLCPSKHYYYYCIFVVRSLWFGGLVNLEEL